MDCMRNQFAGGVLLDGRFETIAPLNHGSFGMVFQAKDHLTGEIVALKCITKKSAANFAPSDFAIDDRSEELKIHLGIGAHPNIVNIVHYFETTHHAYLVLEFCSNGDLYEAIRLDKGPRETEHVRDFMLQLVDAIDFIHSKGIYHRDIKPENIFLTHTGAMKLGDFGLATTDSWSYESAVGSDRYMAPEQYDPAGNGYSPAKADVWAIGICLLNVLFSRNPFATPTLSDPLYADFAADRQTLFDVFPNMSQDTFEVLVNCLAIDPAYRSLSAVRSALERVVSFTTDDEALDEFCTAEGETGPTTANREPLRTPSIQSPQVDNGSFPWAKALAMTPPQPIRQLSAIPDTESYSEDLFPSSEKSDRDWCSTKQDTASVSSFVDSGLGVSFNSASLVQPKPMHVARSKPMPIAGSLPAAINRPFPSLASVLGKKRDVMSKSWSDMWDEEEEELASGSETENVLAVKNTFSGRRTSAFGSEAGSGVSTPRGGLSEMKRPENVNNSRDRSPPRPEEHVSDQTGFVFEDHKPSPARYSPPPKRSAADKWAALGERRRLGNTPAKVQGDMTPKQQPVKTPAKTPVTPSFPRKRSRTHLWRREQNEEQTQQNKNHIYQLGNGSGVLKSESTNWLKSRDWRQNGKTMGSAGVAVKSPSSSGHLFSSLSSHRHHPQIVDDDSGHGTDLGDLEWVGGWKDLHL